MFRLHIASKNIPSKIIANFQCTYSATNNFSYKQSIILNTLNLKLAFYKSMCRKTKINEIA